MIQHFLMIANTSINLEQLKKQIKDKAKELGAIESSIAGIIISPESQIKFSDWVDQGYHGEMNYLVNNLNLRFNPKLIQAGTQTIICIKVPYLTKPLSYHKERLNNKSQAYVSSYAVGRDYHKVVKQILNNLAKYINQLLKEYAIDHQFRAFTDSAPIMEVQLASQSGLGWRGKNTLLLNKVHGSMFFLGELFTNLPLPVDESVSSHCGSCTKCMDICPTNAFIGAYQLDARRCISYLTIENKGTIPEELRPLIGNRIYGCDDCQLVCPWNKFSKLAATTEFSSRHNLDSSTLLELFSWTEEEFYKKMEGSAIRRIGFDAWLRNLAVGIGNSVATPQAIAVLVQKKESASPLVAEHIDWAITQLTNRLTAN